MDNPLGKKSLLIFLSSILIFISIFLIHKYFWVDQQNFPYSNPSSEFEISLKKESTGSTEKTEYYLKAGESDGEATLTPVANSDAGQALVNWNIINIKSTFKNSTAPYAGQVTANITCESQKFLKEEILQFHGRETKIILAVANNRRIFGSCLLDEVKYVAGIWSAYDETRKEVVNVKIFTPIQSTQDINKAQQNIAQIFHKLIKQ